MATTNTPQPSQWMSQSDERIMRLIFLTRRTCDYLARDLISHVLRQQNKGSFQDWLSKIDPEDWHRDLKMHFGSRIPRLDECDTTVLTSIVQKLDSKNFFKRWIDEIRKLRNSVCHISLENIFSDVLYEERIEYLIGFLRNVDVKIFPRSVDCINFVKGNTDQTLEQFCANHPSEITSLLRTLEPQYQKLARQIPCLAEEIQQLKKWVSDKFSKQDDKNQQLDDIIDQNTAEIENQWKILHEQGIEIGSIWKKRKLLEVDPSSSSKKPIKNIPTSKISGREDDVRKLTELFKKSPIVVITGCPGIGKTTLAHHYANNYLPKETSPVKVSFKGFSAEPEEAKDKIIKKIGNNFPRFRKVMQNSDDPLAEFQNCITEISTSTFVILDNLDDIIAANLSQQLEEAMDEITSIEGRVKILGTSRDKTLSPDFVETGRLELQPISNASCLSWLNDQESSLSQEMKDSIAKYSHGVPLILNILYKYVERHKNIEIEELRSIEESKDWEKLKTTLKISFKRLSDSHLLAMQVASVLARQYRFSIKIFVKFFEAVCQTGANASLALRDCQDMHLIEMQPKISIIDLRLYYEYFLHPYIEQYVKNQYCSNIKSRLMCKIFLIFTDLWTKGEFEKGIGLESSDPAENTWRWLFVLVDCSDIQCFTGFATLVCQAAIESHIPLMALTVIIHKMRDEICWLIGSRHFVFVQKLFEIFTKQKNWLQAIAVSCSVHTDGISKEKRSTKNDLKKVLQKANIVLQFVSSSSSDYQMYKSILSMLHAVYNQISDNEFERVLAHFCVTDSIEYFGNFCREIGKKHSRLERRNCIEVLCYLCHLHHDGYHLLDTNVAFTFSDEISRLLPIAESHNLACFKKYTQVCLDLAWDIEMKEKKTLVEVAKALGCSI